MRENEPVATGRLTTFLGTAPGVGKTYAMLTAARRRRAAGDRVVLGWVDAHDRPGTVAALADLEIHPPRLIDYRGREFSEVDVDGLLASEPDLVVIDELAHSWPGV